MFGNNAENECMTFDDQKEGTIPCRIDEILLRKCKAKSIIDILPGYFDTTIICGI